MVDNKYGNLYIVATPIGNLEDITVRALNILRSVDYIAAEDTRHSAILLKHFGIDNKLISLHNFNEKQRCFKLIDILKHGNNIALISDAGTPLISDPGYHLVNLVRQAGITIIPVPGPCAAIAALCVSGFPTDKFVFEGFLPAKANARDQRLYALQTEIRTVIFYESSHRIVSTVNAMLEIFGSGRQAVIARELTKKFETIYSGSLSDLKIWIESDNNQQKGEFVLLVHGDINNKRDIDANVLNILKLLAVELPASKAASLTSKITGIPKSLLYTQLK